MYCTVFVAECRFFEKDDDTICPQGMGGGGGEVNCPPQSIIETWASGEWELAGQRKLTEALLMKKRVTQNSHEEKDLR